MPLRLAVRWRTWVELTGEALDFDRAVGIDANEESVVSRTKFGSVDDLGLGFGHDRAFTRAKAHREWRTEVRAHTLGRTWVDFCDGAYFRAFSEGEDEKRDRLGTFRAEPPLMSGRASCVLIVDDDPHVVALLHETLQAKGIDVGSARDGGQALAWIAAHGPPNVIVTDLQMPGMDGRDLLAALRRDPALAGIPIFVLTGSAPRASKVPDLDGVPLLDKAGQLAELAAKWSR